MGAQRLLERQRILTDRRAKLIESYHDVYEKALQKSVPTEAEMRKLNVDLTFYGDEDLIRAWLVMRKASAGTPDTNEVSQANMAFIRTMRRHLGHKDTHLTDIDLFGVVLSNPEEFEAMLRKEGEA